MPRSITLVFTLFTALVSGLTHSSGNYPEAVLADSVERVSITIWSDGRALDGEIYRPKNLPAGQKVPAIVTSHGWGGDKYTAARYAVNFAQAGFIVITFTHNTWGKSGGNIYLKSEPAVRENGVINADIHIAKKVVDPIDWIQNVRSAVDYLEGEPNVEASRIGAWGTSFGGGIMVANAAKDQRIRAVVTQVAAFPVLVEPQLSHARQRAIDIARGKLNPVPDNIDAMPGLAGSPNFARFLQYQPMVDVALLTVPTLFIAAGNEQMFKNEEHSNKAYEILKEKGVVDTNYHLVAGIGHYGIYFEGFAEGSQLALDWFKAMLLD